MDGEVRKEGKRAKMVVNIQKERRDCQRKKRGKARSARGRIVGRGKKKERSDSRLHAEIAKGV